MSRTRPLTILNVRNVYAFGGSDTALIQWAQALDKSKFRPLLALFANGDDAERQTRERAEAAGIPTVSLPGGRRRRIWRSVRALAALARAERADLLHLHDVKSDLVGLIVARMTGLPVVGSAYAWFGTTSLFRARVYEWLDVWLLKRCAYVLAISETVRAQSIERGLDASRVVSMYSGIDFDAFQVTIDRPVVRASLGAAPDDLLVGNIARLFPEKDQATLLAAVAHVRATLPQVRLVIVGDGPLLDTLMAQARALGIEDRVTFAGFRDDLPAVLQALDLQVHSSIKEGLPVAVCAGLAAGLPVVSTDIDGVAELIRDGDTGALVPPGDAHRLAVAMQYWLQHREAAQALGARARQQMHDEFRLEAVVGRLEFVYQMTVAGLAIESAP